MMDATLEQLTRSPKLSLYYQRIHDLLEDEQQRREEFYRTVNEGEHVEFINGQVMFHSPVKNRHLVATKHLLVLLDAYVRTHALGFVGYEPLMITLTRNDYEPDICFFRSEVSDQFTPTQMSFPPPDLITEVLSPSTEVVDRGTKFEDYGAHGVREYWLVDPEAESIEQYVLRAEEYELLTKARSGSIVSAVVSGFEIPIRAIFDPAENLSALQNVMSVNPKTGD